MLITPTIAIEAGLSNKTIATNDLISGLYTISKLVEDSMGGTSGAIYGIYLNALVHSLNGLVHTSCDSDSQQDVSALLIAAGRQALSELYNYTRARVGDRTMMDVLIPFIETAKADPESLEKALAAAEAGSNATKRMKASFGRASYVDEAVFLKGSNGYTNDDGGIPDAGALGLLSIFTSILTAVKT
jgi:dihydroxyacetone kinase